MENKILDYIVEIELINIELFNRKNNREQIKKYLFHTTKQLKEKRKICIKKYKNLRKEYKKNGTK